MSNAGNHSQARQEPPKRRLSILEMMIDGKEIDAALQRAVREALLRHKKLGHPVAVLRDGRVAIVPPEDIPA